MLNFPHTLTLSFMPIYFIHGGAEPRSFTSPKQNFTPVLEPEERLVVADTVPDLIEALENVSLNTEASDLLQTLIHRAGYVWDGDDVKEVEAPATPAEEVEAEPVQEKQAKTAAKTPKKNNKS
jgi:hypothetical protein